MVGLKLRYDRESFRELTMSQKRLLFVRWLVEHGRLDDGLFVRQPMEARETTGHGV